MRNLKKVLALVMVMALSLTTFAGATAVQFDDTKDASAAQQEAITVLSTLGVINGYTDGTFRPSDIVTRAELAKMLYVIKTGDPTATFYGNADLSKVFKDSVDTWAVPFVNYAYLNGIMVGYEDKTVRANQQVSGVEAAKMALVALGYLPKTEGLEGDNYYNNTVRLASVAGLLKNLGTANMNEGLTRGDTAVLLYNALYANTVQYVGGAATPKTEALSSTDTITLGEEGFNLLDVTGVLVANDQAALGAYWPNVLNDGTATGYSVAGYRRYNIAASGQSRFVYRDYVAANAANPTGGYTDKVVTVNADTDFAQLGRSYRLLITKPSSSSYSSTEVRTVYGILGEAGSVTVTEKTVGDQSTSVLANMINNRYKVVNPSSTISYVANDTATTGLTNGNVTDGTIFINGTASSYEAAYNALLKRSTAKVTYVDNDNDGTADSLFIEDYTLGYVNSVSDTATVILPAGSIAAAKVVLTNGDVAAGDYVAYYQNAADGLYYIKKLDVVTGNVTGYDGSKFTINGAQYTFGSLAVAADQTLLNGYNAVNPTIYSFVTDGSYIVKVQVTGDTKYQKYAVVTSVENSANPYGYPQVQLYTEDNAKVAGNLISVDGVIQSFASNTLNAPVLVSYVQDANGFYLTTQASLGATNVANDTLTYDSATDVWSGTAGSYKNVSGVVFVQDNAGTTIRAYKPGQFITSTFTNGTGTDDVLFFASSPFGLNYIQAAFVTSTLTELPGIISSSESTVIAAVLGVANVTSDANGYTYSYNVATPWSGTQTVTLVPSPAYVEQLVKGSIYRLFLNSDGKVERFEPLLTGAYDSVSDSTVYTRPANTYGTSLAVEEIENLYIDPLTKATTLVTKDTSDVAHTYALAADSNAYFLKKIGTASIASVDWTKLVNPSAQPLPDLTTKRAFIEFNVNTHAITNIWIDTDAAGANYTVAP